MKILFLSGTNTYSNKLIQFVNKLIQFVPDLAHVLKMTVYLHFRFQSRPTNSDLAIPERIREQSHGDEKRCRYTRTISRTDQLFSPDRVAQIYYPLASFGRYRVEKKVKNEEMSSWNLQRQCLKY